MCTGPQGAHEECGWKCGGGLSKRSSRDASSSYLTWSGLLMEDRECRWSALVHFVIDRHRRVVREQRTTIDGRAFCLCGGRGSGDLVVEPPAQIFQARSLEVVPPRVMPRLWADERPIDIHVALRQQIVHPSALLGQIPARVFIRRGASEVNGLVRDIEVTAHEHLAALRLEVRKVRQQPR